MTNRKRVLTLLNDREVVRLDELRGKQSASSFFVDLLNAEYARRRQELLLSRLANNLSYSEIDAMYKYICDNYKEV